VPKGSLYKAGTFSKFSKLAGLFDTSVIKDLDQLKKQYFKLVKIYHPDAGGTNEQFVKLKDEYDKLRNSILRGANLSEEQKKNELEIDEAMQIILDNIINIEGIEIELIGKWIWVGSKQLGFTTPTYTLLKQAGLRYIKKGGKPYMIYAGVESKSRGGYTKEDIEKKYGKTKFEPKKSNKLNGVPKNKAKILAAFNKLKKGLDKRTI
jgi:curved DNA-binding protein CbpA